MRSHSMRGFSLIEMMIVLVVGLIAAGIAFINVGPIVNQSHVNNAYSITLGAMRTARESAVGTRRVYIVAFDNTVTPNKITITQGNTGAVVATYTLPTDTSFVVQGNFPNVGPDGFGTGAVAIGFDQGVVGASATDTTSVYFYPDGSAQDSNLNTNNGVIYLGRTADKNTPRAITVWGATGRLRGWRLYAQGASNYWGQI
jgi:prepilin-type N-terminal cleavage/methylation domain-containing protein